MPPEADGSRRYLVRFGVTALLLISGTLVLVLYVLPERYVLNSGFRESGMSFPTPATPFVPAPVVRTAARPIPTGPAVIEPGPAEVLWADLAPLIREEAYVDALERFAAYLRDFPGDRDVRREYAITLLVMGRAEEAVVEVRRLLGGDDDFDQRRLLARILRDTGRMDEAAVEYRALVDARPDDAELWLEWARAHAWIEEYDEAATILDEALALHPDSVPLRVELARVEFSRDGLLAAEGLLADIEEGALAAEAAVDLRDAIAAALAVPVSDSVPPLPLWEQALVAREADDFERAVDLFDAAIREDPDDWSIWQAYADLLEYELGDVEGARNALLEVERLAPESAATQYRLAQLEIWTGRNQEARARLLALSPVVRSDPERAAPVTAADIEGALGDLDRWGGDRVAAGRRYDLALRADPANERALAGLDALDQDVARTLVEVEQPRVGATSYALSDTDDFSRLDVGGEWVDVEDRWKWGGSAGNRWLDGRGLGGVPTEVQHGVYVDLEAARWWRWGTLRSALQLGAQRVVEDWDYSVGASLTHRGTAERTELRYEHGPAYPVTATLQSAVAGVVQDRLSMSLDRTLDDRWSVTTIAEGAWLRTDLDALPAVNESTARLQVVASLGRRTTPGLTLGLSVRALTFTAPGPVVTDPTTTAEHRLFWDPRVAISAGPFARFERDLSRTWSLVGSLGPGIAVIDERTVQGWDVVPHVSTEGGVRHLGDRFSASFDLFFYQGQFDGYRMYGARLSISARDFSRLGGGG